MGRCSFLCPTIDVSETMSAVNICLSMEPLHITNQELANIIRSDGPHTHGSALAAVEALLDFLQVEMDADKLSDEARLAFLTLLEEMPSLLQEELAVRFFMEQIKPSDFDLLDWQSSERILQFSEILYGLPIENAELLEQLRIHIHHLLRRALQYHEEKQEWEELFMLVEIAPTLPLMDDVELRRLRYRARTYELRRVRRNRNILFAYLAIQVLLVIGLFPILFINAENGELQRQVENLANVQIGDKGYRLFSYTDGLYWAIITAASIGYGDITPVTTTGKIIAAILGTMGVVTVGVIAGLVLKWITPRALD